MRRLAAGQKPRKPWFGGDRLLHLQEICSKSLRFVAQILGFLVIGAANLQQISNKQAAYVPRGQIGAGCRNAARRRAREEKRSGSSD